MGGGKQRQLRHQYRLQDTVGRQQRELHLQEKRFEQSQAGRVRGAGGDCY